MGLYTVLGMYWWSSSQVLHTNAGGNMQHIMEMSGETLLL